MIFFPLALVCTKVDADIDIKIGAWSGVVVKALHY